MIQVERTDFVSVPVQDIARATQFYGETLGLPIVSGDDAWTFSPSWNSGHVAAARATLEAAGVESQGDTLDTGVCHMAFLADPDGSALMLHHRYAE